MKSLIIRYSLSVCLVIFSLSPVKSQSVAINTDGSISHSSAILDVKSINKGMLPPRMNSSQRTGIAAPAAGLFVYDTDTNTYWFYTGTGWNNLVGSGASGWLLTGNTATNPAIHFIGTTDNTNLRFKINNNNAGYLTNNGNVFWGLRSGNSNTNGYSNIAIGTDALKLNTVLSNLVAIGDSALFNNGTNVGDPTFGIENTAIGSKALYSNITAWANTAIGYKTLFANNGNWNTAIGSMALVTNDVGIANTAIGKNAMFNNSIGNFNTAIGVNALNNNTTASQNTAIGISALSSQSFNNTNTTWVSGNTAIGYEALYSNNSTNTTNGINNTGVGFFALRANTIGYENTGVGVTALYSNTSGYQNTAMGRQALFSNTTGKYNNAIGYKALRSNTGDYNIAFGNSALEDNSAGYGNVAIGYNALKSNTEGDNNTAIGTLASNDGINSDNNTIIGGYAHIAANVSNSIVIGINAFTNTPNLALLGNAYTQFTGGYSNWSNFSDGRFKKDMDENVSGLDFIMRLRPVTYHMDVRGLYKFWGISPYGKEDASANKKSSVIMDDAITKKEAIRMSGFVAQEVEKAATDAHYDFDGVIKPSHDKDHYRLAYGEFVVPLVKAMQEQQVIIEKQNKLIDDLLKRVTALETKQ